MSNFKFLTIAIKKWRSAPKVVAPLTKRHLSRELTKEEFSILNHCLERLNLGYKDLFWFCEDIQVHNQMDLCAENKGFSSIKEAFSKEEITTILSAENSLHFAPVGVHEELRVFCHA